MCRDEIRINSSLSDAQATYVNYDEFGSGGYDSAIYDRAVNRYGARVTKDKIMGYGEFGFQSKVMYPGIGDHRLYTVCNAFACIDIHAVMPHETCFEVLYSVIKSNNELSNPDVKYHLVPRVKKFKDYFDLITFDVELD